MRSRRLISAVFATLVVGLGVGEVASGQSPTEPVTKLILIEGTIDPATAGFLDVALEDAAGDGTARVVISFSAEDGLAASADDMAADIQGSPLPLVTVIDGSAGDQVEEIAAASGHQLAVADASSQSQIVEALADEGTQIERVDMPLRFQLLEALVDPNIAFLLLLVGIAGIAIEAFAPGGLLPGVFGLASFSAGVVGAAHLPVEPIGVVLLIAGIALIVAEAHLPSGIAGAFGVAALSASGLTIFDTGSDEYGVDALVVIATAVIVGGLGAFVIQRVVSARHNPILTGEEELPGQAGDVRVALDPVGQIFVAGALWRARPAGGDGRVEVGVRVRVESVDGLTLLVHPIETVTAGSGSSELEGDR